MQNFIKTKPYNICKLALFIIPTLALGTDANEHKYLFLFFILLLLSFFLNYLWSGTVRPLIRSISYIFVRDDIDGAWARSVKLVQFTWYMTFWQTWFLSPIVFLIFNSWLTQRPNLSAVCASMVFGIVILEFICRQLATNWEWKHHNRYWPFSMRRQVMVVFQFFVLCPIILYFVVSREIALPITGIEDWEWPSGWGLIFLWYFGLLLSIYHIENLFEGIFFPDDLFYRFEELAFDELK
ncbi:hypothetical protein N8783_04330 [Alphaproteobacteria bacterium]|nr:hypothetical protein [Alphaproteobacteria bacterium]